TQYGVHSTEYRLSRRVRRTHLGTASIWCVTPLTVYSVLRTLYFVRPTDHEPLTTAMAANLTPQYLEAEAEYKQAKTAEERLAALKKMYTLIPKHKASEKLQADLKTKISAAKEEVEREKKSPKKGGVSYKIPKQGAGQYVIVGAPNAGKSRLL